MAAGVKELTDAVGQTVTPNRLRNTETLRKWGNAGPDVVCRTIRLVLVLQHSNLGSGRDELGNTPARDFRSADVNERNPTKRHQSC